MGEVDRREGSWAGPSRKFPNQLRRTDSTIGIMAMQLSNDGCRFRRHSLDYRASHATARC